MKTEINGLLSNTALNHFDLAPDFRLGFRRQFKNYISGVVVVVFVAVGVVS